MRAPDPTSTGCRRCLDTSGPGRTGRRRFRVGHADAVEEKGTKATEPDEGELQGLGLQDRRAFAAGDRAELVRYALSLGATVDDVTTTTNLGELALDRKLRPRGEHTMGEVVDQAGLDWAQAEPLLRALGLSADPGARTTPGEADAVRLVALVSNDLLGVQSTTQLARVAGNAMARVAETLVGAFRLRVELPRRDAGAPYVDVVKDYSGMAESLLPAFVATLDAVLRRQIVAVAERMWSTDDERSAVTLARTIGFVDLVGYTETAATLSVRQLTEVLMDFDTRTAEMVSRRNGQIVKTIGDEAMFVTEDAADGCRIALDLVEASGGTSPPVRVGLATGEVVSVFGDMYGPDVNLAARLVAAAEPGSAVVSEQVRDVVADGFTFGALPPLALKGFSAPVRAYSLHR